MNIEWTRSWGYRHNLHINGWLVGWVDDRGDKFGTVSLDGFTAACQLTRSPNTLPCEDVVFDTLEEAKHALETERIVVFVGTTEKDKRRLTHTGESK